MNLEEQFYEVVDVPGIESVFADFHAPGHEHTDGEVIGGGQIGFNLQFGHFVVGIEGAIDGNGADASSKYSEFREGFLFGDDGTVAPQQPSDIFYETNFNSRRLAETIYNAFIGGHLGYAWNRLLFLVDGGAAFSDVHFSADDKAATSFFDDSCLDGNCPDVAPTTAGRVANAHPATVVSPQVDGGLFLGEAFNKSRPSHGDILTGWYAGCETDYALNNTVSVGIEYRHVNSGDVTDRFRSGGPVFPGSTRLSLTGDQVVLKVNVMIAHFLPAVQ